MHASPRLHNGPYTIESQQTGDHRTFLIRTQRPDANFAPGERTIALLRGPDNEADYQGFGFVTDHGIRVWASKRGGKFETYARLL